MRLEEIRDAIPETPDFIHERILEEVKNQLENSPKNKEVINRKRKPWKRFRVAAVAALCLLGLSTAVYAGYRFYSMYLEKQGRYGISAGVTIEKNQDGTSLPGKIPEVKIQPDYIPKGMEWKDDQYIVYSDAPTKMGFSISSVFLDQKDTTAAYEDTKVVESEKRLFGTREGIYLKYQNLMEDETAYTQRIYLLCPEEYRMLTIYIGGGVSKEEAYKVAEHISLVETGEMMETKNMYTWSDLVSPETEESDPKLLGISTEDLPVFHQGEPFCLAVSGESSEGEFLEGNQIKVTVEKIQVSDDLSLIPNEEIPEEWKSSIGEDGLLKENHLSYIKVGDGRETLDEVVKTETAKQKLLFATVSYENMEDIPLHHVLYLGTLMHLKIEEGMYRICNPYVGSYAAEGLQNGYETEEGLAYDHVTGDGAAGSCEMGYGSITESYGNGGNYLPVLKPGEPIHVNMAWIVNEKDLPDLYLNLTGEGGSLEFTDAVRETGVVEIGNIN